MCFCFICDELFAKEDSSGRDTCTQQVINRCKMWQLVLAAVTSAERNLRKHEPVDFSELHNK